MVRRARDHVGEAAWLPEVETSKAVAESGSLLVCYELTFWEFRPLVERNGAIAWKLLQALVKRLRAADPS